MESVNPAIKAVFDDYRLHIDDENFDAIKYFVNHPDNQISQLVSDIMAEKNALSPYWRRKGNFIEDEKDLLHTLVPKAMHECKLAYVSFLITQAEKGVIKASQNNDDEALYEFQSRHKKLMNIKQQLCSHLGKRTITS
jgi:hypothetical protein